LTCLGFYANTVVVDTATLTRNASLLIGFLSQVVAAEKGVPALVCLGPEASLVGSAAAARMAGPVDLFVPSSAGQLGRSVRGPIVVIMDGPTWPEEIPALLQTIEHTSGAIAALVFVHEPHDRTFIERLSKSGCPARALTNVQGTDEREQDGRLQSIVPGDLDEHGTMAVFVTSADGSLTEVPPRPWSSWPALAQLNGIRRAAGLYLPAEPRIFRSDNAQPLSRSTDPLVPRDLAGSLWRTLFGGVEDVETLAIELKHSIAASTGLGIAVYARGKQVSCRVCVNTHDVKGLARTIQVVCSELQQADLSSSDLPRPVVLLSVLRSSHVTSPAMVSDGGIRLGEHSLIMRGRSGPAFMLAHVPCFMNWTARQALATLEKKAGSHAAQLWVSPTRTFWIRETGIAEECTGGLPNRRQCLRTVAHLSEEIDLVARHLSEQLNDNHQIANAYYPRVDVVVFDGWRARKAVALSALLRVDNAKSDRTIDKTVSGLAALAEAVWEGGTVDNRPAHVLEQSHILLAMAMWPRKSAFGRLLPLYIERIQGCLDSAGRVRAELPPSAPERPYLPGVLITALATCQSRLGIQVLRDSQLEAALRFFRGRFGKYPRWPEVWWQMRAWSAVYSFWPDTAVKEFLTAMVQWTSRYQLMSGAFLTWEWPTGPCFQTACVAESVVQASRAVAEGESPETRGTMNLMVARALEFCSSLVVDHRHADLWPVPSRAIGGIRSWHGGIELRSDAAGHYLHALIDFRESLAAHGE
jgi:hypothetical protein